MLFCTIRRVIPVRRVLVGLFTGKAFQKREAEPTDSTWCIGTLESGEKDVSTDVALLANDDYFALRQPEFEIVNPLSATPPDQAVATTAIQTAQTVAIPRSEDVVRTEFPKPTFPKSRLSPRKPLPIEPSMLSEDEGPDLRTSFARQSSCRRLPPIPLTAPLPIFLNRRESPPPPHRPGSSHQRYSVSGSAQTHSRTGSYDSVTSDTPLMSGFNRSAVNR